MKSTPIKGVTTTSKAKGNGESRTNQQSPSSHRYWPLNYVHLATRTTLSVDKGGYSSNCKIVPAEFLQLMAKYALAFSKPAKSDHN